MLGFRNLVRSLSAFCTCILDFEYFWNVFFTTITTTPSTTATSYCSLLTRYLLATTDESGCWVAGACAVVYGSWFDHVLPYWKFHLERPDRVMVVSFEELKIELGAMVQRISQFLGKPLGPDALAAVVQHCSFDQMKNNNMVNREVLPISDLFDMSQSKFMRKGERFW